MKSVLMVLFLLGGLAISTADAQSCKPCPPGCCAAAKQGASADASVSLLPGSTANVACTPEQLAACTPEQMAACEGKKMSKKEMKECQATCQPKVASAPTSQAVLAGQPANVAPKPVAPKTSKQ